MFRKGKKPNLYKETYLSDLSIYAALWILCIKMPLCEFLLFIYLVGLQNNVTKLMSDLKEEVDVDVHDVLGSLGDGPSYILVVRSLRGFVTAQCEVNLFVREWKMLLCEYRRNLFNKMPAWEYCFVFCFYEHVTLWISQLLFAKWLISNFEWL